MIRRPFKAGSAKGFTLIELLVVVAIIGVLTGILLPVFQGALQKAKQKSTMSDINNIARAITSYFTDMGAAPPSPSGNLEENSAMYTALTPFHIQTVSNRDRWGFPFQVWTGVACAGKFGIDGSQIGPDDFLIQSLGRDGLDEGFTFDPSNPENSFYIVQTMEDFNKDLIIWSGNWIRAPRHANMKS
jgi:prepilin-type N-terminal cleavage/methylation domain-containing protein